MGNGQPKTEKIVLDVRPQDSKDRDELSVPTTTILLPYAAPIDITPRQSSRLRCPPSHLAC
jgi:hypothetical protein